MASEETKQQNPSEKIQGQESQSEKIREKDQGRRRTRRRQSQEKAPARQGQTQEGCARKPRTSPQKRKSRLSVKAIMPPAALSQGPIRLCEAQREQNPGPGQGSRKGAGRSGRRQPARRRGRGEEPFQGRSHEDEWRSATAANQSAGLFEPLERFIATADERLGERPIAPGESRAVHLFLLRRHEFQHRAVDAIAQAGRLGPVRKNMAEMAPASGAMHFGAPHALAGVRVVSTAPSLGA